MGNGGVIIIEGHVQGLSNVRSLGEAGIPVYVVDKGDCIARYSKYCKKFFRCPPYESNDLADFLIKIATEMKLQNWLLLPSNDHAVLTISKHKKRLEQYYKVITQSIDIIQNIYDKSKLLKIAKDSGVPFPETYYFRSVDEAISKNLPFPVIIKGRNGLSFYKALGKKAFLAINREKLITQLKRISHKIEIVNTLIQEVVPFTGTNNTISFTAFCEVGTIKTYWIGQKLREHPLQFGTATFCTSILCEELIKPSAKLIKSLNFTGVCEIEYLKDPRDNVYKLIEINARTWLWVGLAKTCGINYPLIIYNFINGVRFTYPDSYKINIQWINYLTDIPYSMAAIFIGKLNLLSYIRSLKKVKVDALWYKNDIKPFFAYFLLSFHFY